MAGGRLVKGEAAERGRHFPIWLSAGSSLKVQPDTMA